MWKPGQRRCELCQAAITDPIFPMFMLPVTREQLDRVLAAIRARFDEEALENGNKSVRILGDIMPPPFMPSHVRFDFCKGCVDGFMPLLEQLSNRAIDVMIQQFSRRKERAASGGEKRRYDVVSDDDD